jgi:hypothetical protein
MKRPILKSKIIDIQMEQVCTDCPVAQAVNVCTTSATILVQMPRTIGLHSFD